MEQTTTHINLQDYVRQVFRKYGPPKAMGSNSGTNQKPHFFLHRKFLEEHDLAILFNTKRCRYNCHFCGLPNKSSTTWISEEDVNAQFKYVINEIRNSIGVLDRLTIANEGSVFDEKTFPWETLLEIVYASKVLPRLKRVVIESRLEFVTEEKLNIVKENMKAPILDILTGFETLDEYLRDTILGKQESLQSFQDGLDVLEKVGAHLTAYVLFKPHYEMSDEEAWDEAEKSIDYVVESCKKRNIPLTIRLNPMYMAEGTKWAVEAQKNKDYKPPKLSDVLKLAKKKIDEGVSIYLGLTSEGLSDEDNTYRAREDFDTGLLKEAIIMNG